MRRSSRRLRLAGVVLGTALVASACTVTIGSPTVGNVADRNGTRPHEEVAEDAEQPGLVRIKVQFLSDGE